MRVEIMMKMPASKVEQMVVGELKRLDGTIEKYGEATDVWPIYFFKPSGKWKYIDFIVMPKPELWREFGALIQQSLRDTPLGYRQTKITDISSWTVVMPNTPLGFPIMVSARTPRAEIRGILVPRPSTAPGEWGSSRHRRPRNSPVHSVRCRGLSHQLGASQPNRKERSWPRPRPQRSPSSRPKSVPSSSATRPVSRRCVSRSTS